MLLLVERKTTFFARKMFLSFFVSFCLFLFTSMADMGVNLNLFQLTEKEINPILARKGLAEAERSRKGHKMHIL